MSILCKLFGHKWNGCKCEKCGDFQDIGHNYVVADRCIEKCSICGKELSLEHKWNGCKCEKCDETRNVGHNYIELERIGCICEKCGKEWDVGRKSKRPGVFVIDNTSESDNWIINECDFKVTVCCDEPYGSFSVDLQPGESKRITCDVKANAYSYTGDANYDNLIYQIGNREKWMVREKNGSVIMVKIQKS